MKNIIFRSYVKKNRTVAYLYASPCVPSKGGQVEPRQLELAALCEGG